MGLSEGNPPVRVKINRVVKPGSWTVSGRFLRLSLTLTKVVINFVSVLGGNFGMCINPPHKEIKLRTCLSKVIRLKHFTAQIRAYSDRFGKSA